MVGDATQRLIVGIVGLVWGLFGGVGRLDNDIGGVLGEGAQVGDVLGVFGDNFRHDIGGACEGFFGGIEAGFLIDVRCGCLDGRATALGACLHNDHVGKRLKPRLAGFLGARHALLAIGFVEVLDALQLLGFANLLFQLGREFALGVDEHDDILFTLLKIAQVAQAFVERAEGDVIHAASRFFAVAGDKGDGVPLVDELDGCVNVGDFEIELASKLCDEIHRTPSVRWCV